MTDFKQTEIGPIPEHWEVVRLGDIFDVKQGKALSPKYRRGVNPKPFLRTANVFWGRVDLSTLDKMDFTKEEVPQLRLLPGDLLVCEGGDIGRTAMWQGSVDPCCYQNHLHRLRSQRADVCPTFYMYWMHAAFLLLNLYGGVGNKTTIPNLSRARLTAFAQPKPPLSEQHAIAHILCIVQQAKEATERVVAATRELKKSLMHHLFTYGPVPVDQADQVPLKETELGPVPEHWKVVPLGRICDSSAVGPRFSGNLYDPNGNVATLRTTDIDDGNINYQTMPLASLNLEKFKNHFLQPNDLVITRSGTCGIAAVFTNFDFPVLPGAFLIRFRLTSLVNPHFLQLYLNSATGRRRVLTIATGAVQKNLSGTSLLNFEVPLPSLHEQHEIVHSLQIAERKLETEETRKLTLDNLFKTLLHHLMTGKVQVKESEAQNEGRHMSPPLQVAWAGKEHVKNTNFS